VNRYLLPAGGRWQGAYDVIIKPMNFVGHYYHEHNQITVSILSPFNGLRGREHCSRQTSFQEAEIVRPKWSGKAAAQSTYFTVRGQSYFSRLPKY
jgi:hypothetical protein